MKGMTPMLDPARLHRISAAPAGYDGSIPQHNGGETHPLRATSVTLHLGAFMAVALMPVMLIFCSVPEPSRLPVLLALLAATGRSRLVYLHLRRT